MPGVTYDTENKTMILSQSWLSTFLRCPSLAGRELRGELADSSTDATELGTAWHNYVEMRGDGTSVEEAAWKADEWLRTAVQQDGFKWVKVKTIDTLVRYLDVLCETYEDQIHGKLTLEGAESEIEFHLPLAHHEGWSIELKGSIDRYDPKLGLLDWKTASRTGPGSVWDPYGIRHKIQADAYTFAAAELGYMARKMTFVVATKGPRQQAVEWLDVDKGPTDWAWLKQVAVSALESAQVDVWPVNHTSALCSAKWCEAWDQCRGAVVSQVEVDLAA